VHVSAVKPAEDGAGLIIRIFNPGEKPAKAGLRFSHPIKSAARCRMDESLLQPLKPAGNKLLLVIEAKKIYTLRVQL